jgi:hypothetical protein
MALGVSAAGASSGGAGTGGGKPGSGRHASAHNTQSNPFVGRGMWIWELPSSNGGNVSSIIARAHRYGINVLMIKSGDGSGTWSQFTPGLVSRLHAAGFRVCGWQYVYGAHPVFEAQVGAATVRDGADCLLIDAEAEYENRANNYMQAQTYISQLRRQIGASFPLALAGFPYMDFHPGFPFSVFLGPGGAQYNVPQMYWFDIGTSVDHVYSHTYALNRIYQRPIFPLGQIYNSPPLSDIRRFRQLSRAYGAAGVSWWDWQEASPGDWRAMSQPVGWLNTFQADASLASVSRGAQGDLVVWAQEHLFAAGQRLPIDGSFGSRTQSAVRRFQRATGLPVTGTIGRLTWQRLLRYQPVRVRWTTSGARTSSVGGYSLTMPVPASSRLPAKRNEIAGAGGAGRPKH